MFHYDFCVLKITVIWYFDIFWKDWYSCRMVVVHVFCKFFLKKFRPSQNLQKLQPPNFCYYCDKERQTLQTNFKSLRINAAIYPTFQQFFVQCRSIFCLLLFFLSLCSLFTSFVYIYCRICRSLILFK